MTSRTDTIVRRAGTAGVVLLLWTLSGVIVSAQTPVVRYTMDPGSVPPASQDTPRRDPGVVVTKALDGQPLRNGPAYMANWDGTVAWNAPTSFTTAEFAVKTNGRYFVRQWFRADADVDAKDGAKIGRIGFPGGVFFEPQFGGGTGATLKAQAGESVFWGGAPFYTRRGWHKLETAIAPNQIRVWLDDREVVPNRPWSGISSGNVVNIMSNWSSNPGWEHDATNHMYFDDIEVYSDVAGHDANAMWAGTIGEGDNNQPPPTECQGTWSEWARVLGSETACVNSTRNFTESRSFTVTQPGQNCPVSPETRVLAEACIVTPPPPPPDQCAARPILVSGIAWPGNTEGTRSGRFTWNVSGSSPTLVSAEWLFGPQRLVVQDSRGCSVTVTR